MQMLKSKLCYIVSLMLIGAISISLSVTTLEETTSKTTDNVLSEEILRMGALQSDDGMNSTTASMTASLDGDSHYHPDFPCHYITNRQNEYSIIPHFERKTTVETAETAETWTFSKYDISIATMMSPSEDMFNRLREMIARWSGPISVAVFISNQESTKDVELAIQQFWLHNDTALAFEESNSSSNSNSTSNLNGNGNENENDGKWNRKRVSFHLVSDWDKIRGADKNMFPRNLLRNVAVDNAEANHVLVLDVDFAPSAGAYENLKRHLKKLDTERRWQKLNNKKYALVVPAFEVIDKGDVFHDYDIESKDKMLAMKKKDRGVVLPFMKREKYAAHFATNSQKWYYTNKLYLVKYKEDYEPYVVVRKGNANVNGNDDSNDEKHSIRELPPFWEHFTGFGRNKLQWIEELYLSGYAFIVVPDTFVLHKAHKSYGLRKLRPYIADEYVFRFQEYLIKTYGKTMRAMDPLVKWREYIYGQWEEKVVQKRLTTSYTTMFKMSELSKRREADFRACFNSRR